MSGTRDLETSSANCRALDDQLALVVALLIDPAALIALPTPPIAPPLPLPSPAVPLLAAAPMRTQSVLFDNGDGTFGGEVVYHAGGPKSGFAAVVPADLDGDGLPDLVVVGDDKAADVFFNVCLQ